MSHGTYKTWDDFSLSKIFLGNAEGKREAALEDFENFYYDHGNIATRLVKQKTTLLLGAKGSGKTILAEYIKKTNTVGGTFVAIETFYEFQFHNIVNYKSDDIGVNIYKPIWKWIILTLIAKQLLNDHSIDSKETECLTTFFKKNYGSIDIKSKKIINNAKAIKCSLQVLSGEMSILETSGSYLDYLESMEKTILYLLEKSEAKYILFFDELDDEFKNEDYYKDSIISLIKAANNYNIEFLQRKIDAQITILLRSDIFRKLNDSDLNKIKEDSTISLNWVENKITPDCLLLKLITHKVKRSYKPFRGFSHRKIFHLLFPDRIKLGHLEYSPDHFILHRTLFRPRDIIRFLTKALEKFPDEKAFTNEVIHNVRSSYSKYLLAEIKNEMCGHESPEFIEQGFFLLKELPRKNAYSDYEFDQIIGFYNGNKDDYPAIDNIFRLLTFFFNFNVIGNLDKLTDYDTHTWYFRDYDARLNRKKKIRIHPGLTETLCS